ncbi:MAG: hypothetical protein ACLFV8_05270 [Alphaproteobacteria bacterium]
MTDFNWPLPGAVTQAVNPWEVWMRTLSAQMGFLNIRNLSAGDPALEREIVEDVASYGRQLGRMTDVLIALLDHTDLKHVTERERAEIAAFREMAAEIETVKARRRSPERLLDALDALLEEIRGLREQHPELHERAWHRVRQEAAHAARLTAPEAR